MRSHVPLLIIVLSFFVLLGILALDRMFIYPPEAAVSLSGGLSKAQEKSIDLLADLAKLVITITTGLLGLLTFYIKDRTSGKIFVSPVQAGAMCTAACAALASIYFGHRTISALVEMLANDYYAVTDYAVARAVILQYVFLCLAALSTIWFVVLRRAADEEAVPAPPAVAVRRGELTRTGSRSLNLARSGYRPLSVGHRRQPRPSAFTESSADE